MRKGNSEMLGLISQLVFAALLMAMLISFANSLYDDERFAETIVAVDGALTLESLQAKSSGTIQALQPLGYEFEVGLKKYAVTTVRSDREGGKRSYFSHPELITVEETQITARSLEWKRVQNAMSVRGFSVALGCDLENLQYESIALRSNNDRVLVQAQHLLERALYQIGIGPDTIYVGDENDPLPKTSATLTFLLGEENTFSYAPSSTSRGIGCLFQSRLATTQLPIVTFSEDPSLSEGFVLEFTSDTDREMLFSLLEETLTEVS